MSDEAAANGGRVRRAFRAYMRHELRTPINAIIGYSELLLEEADECGYEAFVPDIQKMLDAGKLLLVQVNAAIDSTQNPAMRNLDVDKFETEVGHALRTPINTVIGYAEMLLEDAASADLGVLVADLKKIHGGAQQMLHLLHELVELARVEAGEKDLSQKQEDADAILQLMDHMDGSTNGVTALAQERASLLVVDDNPANCQLLSRRLERDHYEVTTAGSGPEALALLQKERFDLILLDIVMPGMNGYQVLQKLKADDVLRHVPVVALSSLDDVDGVAACIELGADDYLSKPYNPVLLNARINACLERKRLHDREAAYLEQIRIEREKSDRLLLNILPEPIANRLKAGESVIVDQIPETTILFADLVGFTPLTVVLPPERLIALLNRIFSAFDDRVERRGLEKVKTSGDAYMAVGGLLHPQENPVAAVAELGLDMLDCVARLREEEQQPIELRVGMDTGPVVAGVIGTSKLLYDLWGDTVNTASRMESHGVPGALHVTSAVHAHLKDQFPFEARGAIPVKGKGQMETFLLRRS